MRMILCPVLPVGPLRYLPFLPLFSLSAALFGCFVTPPSRSLILSCLSFSLLLNACVHFSVPLYFAALWLVLGVFFYFLSLSGSSCCVHLLFSLSQRAFLRPAKLVISLSLVLPPTPGFGLLCDSLCCLHDASPCVPRRAGLAAGLAWAGHTWRLRGRGRADPPPAAPRLRGSPAGSPGWGRRIGFARPDFGGSSRGRAHAHPPTHPRPLRLWGLLAHRGVSPRALSPRIRRPGPGRTSHVTCPQGRGPRGPGGRPDRRPVPPQTAVGKRGPTRRSGQGRPFGGGGARPSPSHLREMSVVGAPTPPPAASAGAARADGDRREMA